MATIQPVVFTLDPDAELCTLPVVQAAFPSTWVRLFGQLQAELRDRRDAPNTPPWRSLNAVVRALVPYLLVGPKLIGGQQDQGTSSPGARPWLLARERVPNANTALWLIVRAWLEHHYGTCNGLDAVRAQIVADDIIWDDLVLNPCKTRAPNDTAHPPALAYDALPGVLADYLVAQGLQVPVRDELRGVVRIPAPHDHGAALVTWPPVYHLRGRAGAEPSRHGYSYLIVLTAQTMLGDPRVRIHAHYSMRRWQSQALRDGERLYLLRGNTTAFIGVRQTWLGLPATPSFTAATLRTGGDADGNRVAVWTDGLPNIARWLDLPLPDAEEVVRDPMRWLQGQGGFHVAIGQRTRRAQVLGSGIDNTTREQLTRALASKLASQASLCPPLTSLPTQVNRPRHDLAQDVQEMPSSERLAALEESVGGTVRAEICWQTEAVRDRLAAATIAFLTGQPEPRGRRRARPSPPPPVFDAPREMCLPGGGRLYLVPRRLGALVEAFPPGEALPASVARLAPRERLKALIQERADALKQALEPCTEPTLALVEMDNFRSRALRQRFGWRRDPKLAVRLGLARTGRVSQFLAADPIDTLDDRARAAVRDGFRQLGYLPARITFSLQSGLTLPDGLHVAAVWTVQVTRRKAFQPVYIPVVVVIPADRRQVLAWLPDGKTPALRPYRQALLDLTRLDPEAVRRSGRAKALTALQGFLTRDLPYSGVRELAVLVVAQNMRGTWKGLANKDIELDKVRFEERGAALPVASMAGRPRIIRLRDASEGQTPAWYLPGRTAGATAQGLCRADEDPGRTYYNIAAKSLSAGTRLVRSKQEDPTKRHVQQSILEIVPLAVQDPREVELCAVAVDQWRRMTYLMRKREMTLYPLPLRFAVKMDDYARVIGPWLLADEWDPEEDDPVADDDAEDLADDSSLS